MTGVTITSTSGNYGWIQASGAARYVNTPALTNYGVYPTVSNFERAYKVATKLIDEGLLKAEDIKSFTKLVALIEEAFKA